MRGIAAMTILVMAALPARADDAMAAAANAFYAASAQARPATGGGIPDATGRARYAPVLSARLNKALSDAAAAETRFSAKTKGAPPLIEGDIFSSLFEGPTQWAVKDCNGDAKTARCSVTLTRQSPGQRPVTWTDTLVLANAGGWKVDDVIYDPNLSSGNTGTLNETLRMVQSEAP
jgi:hypothetical protein